VDILSMLPSVQLVEALVLGENPTLAEQAEAPSGTANNVTVACRNSRRLSM
jgi:hypothetical protein